MQALVSRREERKQGNRQKLIDATLELIAEGGLGAVTVGSVVARAGVSRGLINLHFDTKEAMLVEVMVTLSQEWEAAWRAELDREGQPAADRLLGLLQVNFLPPVFDEQKLTSWHCFYADPGYRAAYHRHCFTTDQAHLHAIAELVEALDLDGGYGLGPPLLVARSLRATTGGLWLELLTEPQAVSLEEARAACRLILQRFFPKHFAAADGKRRLDLVTERR